MVEGDAQKRFPAEEGHLWNLPVILIDWFDAVAYCRFRSERDGIEIRLPTELEWEKAARGTDGRFYPWGDHFDPTFCLMRSSRPFLAQPEPVGTFPIDTSPYGVRDMAGGVREWVADVNGEGSWAETSGELGIGRRRWRGRAAVAHRPLRELGRGLAAVQERVAHPLLRDRAGAEPCRSGSRSRSRGARVAEPAAQPPGRAGGSTYSTSTPRCVRRTVRPGPAIDDVLGADGDLAHPAGGVHDRASAARCR